MSTSAWSQAGHDRGRGVVEVGLVVIEEHEQGRVELGHLAGDLRADRASGAR